MISGLHIGTELRRFGHGKLPPLALVVIICLPLIFGALFVWSYFDPIGRLDKLPVAVVNSDEGADSPQGRLDAGQQVVDGLLDNRRLDFHVVDAEEARAGLDSGRYYFAVEIPHDFSAAGSSIRSGTPRSATINVAFNNRNGFISTTLGNMVTLVMVDTVDATIGRNITNQLLVGLSTVGHGIDQAADGAGQLAAGATTAHDGATTLAGGTRRAVDGAGRLADGAATLNDGMGQAQAGTNRLRDGIERLDSGLSTAQDGSHRLAAGLSRLQQATQALASGAGQVADGVDKVSDVAGQLDRIRGQLEGPLVSTSAALRAAGQPGTIALANQIDATLNQLRATTGTQATGAQLEQLRAGARTIATELSDPAAQYVQGIDAAATGSQQLSAGIDELKNGSGQLVVGARTLADAASRLVGGTQQLTVGASALRDGLVELDAGSGRLRDGLGRLDDGAGELSLKMRQAGSQVPTWEGQRLDDASRVGGQPVVRNLVADEMREFGIGLAPFFLSLAMFMGGTICWMVLRPLQSRAVDSGARSPRVVAASYLPGLIVGVCQATLVWAVVEAGVGLGAVHPLALWVALLGVSATFIAATQAVNAVVGVTAGRVLCLMLMAIQLVSSGGLYPVETQPRLLQWVHHIDPMTYSVDLFRGVILGFDHDGGRALHGAVFLAAVLLGAWVVSCLSARWHRQILHKDLHPELAV